MTSEAKRAQYTLEFKLEAVRPVKAGQSMAAVAAKCAFIEHYRHYWPVPVLSEVLEVSPSGYRQRRQCTANDKPHRSRVSNDALLARVNAIHTQVEGE
jgi:hypothetical protein